MSVIFAALIAFAAHAEKESCMDIACRMGHCKFTSSELTSACAGSNDSCVRAACKDNMKCKWEHDFIKIAQDCSPKPVSK